MERPTTPAQATAWKRSLCDWQPVDAFAAIVRAIRREAGDHVLDDPRLGFWREAWIAARFAEENGLERLRLCQPDPPDFEVDVAGEIVPCEAVEVVRADRRRGDDLRRGRAFGRRIEPHDFISSEEVRRLLALQLRKKAGKGYPVGTWLVVYLNVGFVAEHGVKNEVWATAAPFTRHFICVSLLWGRSPDED